MITLTTPVAFNGKTYTALTLRRAKVKDLEAAEIARKSGGDFEMAMTMIASLADVPIDVVREMDVEDFTTLSESLPSFFPAEKKDPTGAA